MSWNIVFSPLVPGAFIWLVLALAVLTTLYSVWSGLRGAIMRGAALGFILLALANPSILEEEREPINDVAVIVVDNSPSQNLGNRPAVTQATLEKIQENIARYGDLEVRIIDDTTRRADGSSDGTNLFGTLEKSLIYTPPERIAGVIMITDGQIHDVPEQPSALGFDAPIHALITGKKNERDRKLTVKRAPRYGIVGESLSFTVLVNDSLDDTEIRTQADLIVRVDGKIELTRRVLTDMPTEFELELEHGGQNVIELEVTEGPEELTLQNNRAVVLTNGIRDQLRVLLVSGEPHTGERTWRNLLKADPSVSLVHFTILRPPEKQDGTPIGELSLIAFPTRELFSVKLEEFDLIIFDRYRRRGVLPLAYLGNVAKFVENGGALLMAAGPAFSTPYSLYRSPLAAVLPGQPTGDVFAKGFKPQVTTLGYRHPVTAELPGAPAPPLNDRKTGEATWGRWFRLIESRQVSGNVLMSGPEGRPLLILDRFEDGRVAQLMSDHSWLWARGFEGGGPQAEMLRRLAHWLMKEPDLEEEDLHAIADGGNIEIIRRSMADQVGSITLTAPSGATKTIEPQKAGPGMWKAVTPAEEMGLYRLNDENLSTVAAVGPLNPKEFSDVRSTDATISQLATSTDGSVFWVADGSPSAFGLSDGVSVPDIRRVRAGRDTVGRGWIGLKKNNQHKIRSVTQMTLFTAPLAFALILGSLLIGWYREGR